MYGSMIQNVADKYISSWEKRPNIFFEVMNLQSLPLDKARH